MLMRKMIKTSNPYDLGRSIGNSLATILLLEKTESSRQKKRVVAIYAGRFQPFHRGHYSVYKHLVDRFGVENVFIGTSDKVNMPKSPFSFAEKEKIITSMFDIPTDKVRQVKSPFAPEEILDDFDAETTTFVTAFSEKDAGRLAQGKYYQALGEKDPSELEGYRDKGYYIVAPVFKMEIGGKNISGTQVRSVLGDPKASTKAKDALFRKLYGKTNPEVFNLIIARTTEAEKARQELAASEKAKTKATDTEKKQAQPGNLGDKKIVNPETGRTIKVKSALGYDKSHPAYKLARTELQKESVLAELHTGTKILYRGVSNKNIISVMRPNSLGVLYFTPWKDAAKFHAQMSTSIFPFKPELAGRLYQAKITIKNPMVVGDMKYDGVTASKRFIDQAKKDGHDAIVSDDNKAVAVFKPTRVQVVKEDITISVEIGDTILTGRFKNKKTLVKTIGTDAHGMPTINGRKVATFRIVKSTKKEGKDMINRTAVLEYRRRAQLVSEGGAAGHMAHPFDDFDLTFGDLKSIVELGLEGKLNVESPVTEKLDGQNISVSWRDDKGIVFARNKGHLKDRGVNAMTVDGVKQMFAGRGEISDAFTLAAEDLSSGIRKLSATQRDLVFAQGSKWMSMEIIFPATQNVIPYGHKTLIFHNTLEVDEKGNVIGVGADAGRMLAGMLKQINQNIQKTFRFGGPVVVNLPKTQNFARKKGQFVGRIIKLQNQFRLRDNDPVMMWHQRWWEDFIDKQASHFRYRMPNNVRQGLLKRWAFQQLGAYTSNRMKKEIVTQNTAKDAAAHKFLDWALKFDKGGKQDQFKKNIAPFEKIFLQLGAEILLNARGLLSVAPGSAAESLRKELDKTVADLRKTADINQMQKVNAQLRKLQSIGLDKIVPTEGIVFMFKGKLFKFTGTFAPINQILGVLKFAGR